MAQPENLRSISEGSYRARRAYLADHCFLEVPGGGAAPSDPLGAEQWAHLMDLPTDVLLRTTDYLGSMLDDMQTQAYTWLCSIPIEPSAAPFVFDALIDAHDEFKAAPFIAAHGLYRQATAALRNALEVMAHAVRFAVRSDQQGFDNWRNGSGDPPKLGNSVDLIGVDPTAAAIEATLSDGGLFGVRPDGVLRSLYTNVCRYAHSLPGHTNADIWKSNGPVFIPRAFTGFWLDFCDVLLACYVLFKIGYPGHEREHLTLPGESTSSGSPPRRAAARRAIIVNACCAVGDRRHSRAGSGRPVCLCIVSAGRDRPHMPHLVR